MIRQGAEISDTYRNENGIALQLSAMQYIMTNGEVGLSGGSALFVKVANLFSEDRAAFESKLATAKKYIPQSSLWMDMTCQKPEPRYLKIIIQ